MNVNPDLAAERKKCTFDTSELTNIYEGGPERIALKKLMFDFFLSGGDHLDPIPLDYLSHEDKYEMSLKKALTVFKKMQVFMAKHPDISARDMFDSIATHQMVLSYCRYGIPVGIHTFLFIPALIGQCTPEQLAKWLPRAINLEYFGTYAQTELGHGTFLKGLETTATYDKNTQEFVIHSPSLTSYKWWPGNLGKTSNYAIIMAQLFIDEKCYGIHPFIVQLRDEETHMPLPGIQVGEIGSKMSFNGTDNGYLGFEHVRIPREHLLMKNAQVLPDGTYVKGKSEKLVYSTLIFARCNIVRKVVLTYLQAAVIIATRYSAVRRQGVIKPQGQEIQILDYGTQQYKLIPQIAVTFAIHFSANWLMDMYNVVTSEIKAGDLERLPELHALACCMKAVHTTDGSNAVDECRRACGGHGYVDSSGLPGLYSMITASQTYEGENTVLYLQTAKYLMKIVDRAQKGEKLPATCQYMAQGVLKYQNRVWSNTIDNVIEAYNHVACGLAHSSAERLQRLVNSGKDVEVAWNEASNILVECAEMHCRAFVVKNFFEIVSSLKASTALKHVLMQLAQLYSVYFLLKRLGYFLMYSNVKGSDVESLQEWEESLLSDLRPNAVSLVDSFNMPDVVLDSTLGAFDGNVYNRLLEAALKSPLNSKPVHSSFHKYLKPFLRSNI